ncbi:MAG: GGDEF domain-containing response regulator [Nitrospira sp.]|nr:GGDEF domain-containing response regulator [Nitrospira sp.]
MKDISEAKTIEERQVSTRPLHLQVLLVEDNPGDARLVTALLTEVESNPIQLTHVSRLSDALETLQAVQIDAVLLDLSLPDVSGMEGLQRLKQAYPEMPIVVLTGAQHESLMDRAKEYGADAYLQKGAIDGAELFLAVRQGVERHHMEDHEAVPSSHDSLTGLANRRILMERLNQMVMHARKAVHPICVLCVGLDNFKLLNERLGRRVCDDLLRMAANRLRECVREADTIARTGGDEFIVLMDAPIYQKFVEVTAGKMLDVFTKPILTEGESIVIDISIGAVEFPKDGFTSDILIRHAGRALFAAKSGGGRQMCWYGAAALYS